MVPGPRFGVDSCVTFSIKSKNLPCVPLEMPYDFWVNEVVEDPAPQWTTPSLVCVFCALILTLNNMAFKLKNTSVKGHTRRTQITGVSSLLASSSEPFRSLQFFIVNGPVVLIEILNILWSLSAFANFFYPGPFQQAIGGRICWICSHWVISTTGRGWCQCLGYSRLGRGRGYGLMAWMRDHVTCPKGNSQKGNLMAYVSSIFNARKSRKNQ